MTFSGRRQDVRLSIRNVFDFISPPFLFWDPFGVSNLQICLSPSDFHEIHPCSALPASTFYIHLNKWSFDLLFLGKKYHFIPWNFSQNRRRRRTPRIHLCWVPNDVCRMCIVEPENKCTHEKAANKTAKSLEMHNLWTFSQFLREANNLRDRQFLELCAFK